MPRNSRHSAKNAISDDSEEEEVMVEDLEEEEDDEEERSTGARKKKGGTTNDNARGRRRRRGLDDDEEEREEEEDDEENAPNAAGAGAASSQKMSMFTSQVGEATQDIHEVKDSELRNLLSLQPDKQEKAVRDLFRAVLFRAHQMEPIDRAKCVKEAGISKHRVSSAAFKEVEAHLQNLFGYGLKRIPPFMEKMKGLPAAAKDRYYVINSVEDDTGEHSVRRVVLCDVDKL
jgi:MAGE family